MVRLDPLWVVIGIEALVLFVGLSAFLGYRLFIHSRHQRQQETALLKAIDTTIKLLKENISRIQEKDTETSMRKKGLELEIKIISTFRDSLKKGLIDRDSFNETFFEGSQKAVTEFIEWFKKFTEKKDEIITRARAALKQRDEALQKLQDALKKKKAQVEELIASAEKQKILFRRLQFVKQQNQKLKELIAQLKEKAREAEQLKEIVAALEATNRDLSTCVEILEQENTRLTEQLRQYQQMIQLFDESGQIIEKLKADKGLQEILQELKEKDEEIKRLRKELETLEKEYMSLYQRMAK